MAEENVVLPKERYQRLLDQIEKYKNAQNKEVDEETMEGSTTDTHESATTREQHTEDTDDPGESGHNPTTRTRDDAIMDVERPAPPGLTPAELRAIIVSEQKNKRKKKKNINTLPRKSPSVRTTSHAVKKQKKNLKLVKKNWLTL